MYLKKKKGFVLLEVIAFLAVILTLIMLYSKIYCENVLKSSLYTINDDIYSLNNEERNLIAQVTLEINADEAIKAALRNNAGVNNNNFTYEKISTENNKLKLQIKNGRCFLILTKSDTVFYREFYIKDDPANNKFVIIPSTLKGYNFDV